MNYDDRRFQLTVVENMMSDRFEITGDLGSDGGGSCTHGSFRVGDYYVFYKRNCNAGDSSVNHLLITNAESPNYSAGPCDGASDQSLLTNVQGSSVIYLLFAGVGGVCYEESVFMDMAAIILGEDLSLFCPASDCVEIDGCTFDTQGVLRNDPTNNAPTV
eukprot:UN33194